MKTSILLTLFLAIILIPGCYDDDNIDNQSLSYLETKKGGCADGLPPPEFVKSGSSIEAERSDTVYYYIEENSLIVFVGFETTCCILYDSYAVFEDGIIKMYLDEIQNDPCDCICWYEFNFKFKDFEYKSYPYEVRVDGKVEFSGVLDIK
ncbi:hypothetical protein ACFLSQ_03945 [Bacteroidota bacterium]